MKKRFLAAALCAVMAVSLTGCGKEETSAPADTSSTTSTSTTSSTTQQSSSTTETSSAPESKPEESKPEESSESNAPDYSEIFSWNPALDPETGEAIGVGIEMYLGSDENIVFPAKIEGKPVIYIGDRYFRYEGRPHGLNDNSIIKSVTIPAGVEEIICAFKGCENLEEVTFLGGDYPMIGESFRGTPWYDKKIAENPDSLFILGNYLVQADPGKTSGDVVIPDGITKINDGAFYFCHNVTSITVPEGVTEIGAYAFQTCDRLASIALPDSVVKLGENAFIYSENLTSVTYKGQTYSSANFDDLYKAING